MQENRKFLEWTPYHADGLYASLMSLLEWICYVQDHPELGLFINFQGTYGCQENSFSHLFKPFDDPQITTDGSHRSTIRLPPWPIVGAEGIGSYAIKRYGVYCTPRFYTDPDFFFFRRRMQPLIAHYLQPIPSLQLRVDRAVPKGNRPYTIGIHVRYMGHYRGCQKSQKQFLDDIERDIDEIMKRHPSTTQIFLATMLNAIVERISAKYQVLVNPISRTSEATLDWRMFPGGPTLKDAEDVVVDEWCLANCDEVWGSSSNLMLFLGCLNPNLSIQMLPSLKRYDGN